MKQKRKIKVPAAAYGIETNYADLLLRQGNAYTRMNNFQLGMLKKDQLAATNFTQSLNAENNNFFNDLQSKYGNAGKSVGTTGNPIVDKAGNIGEATFNAIGSSMDQFGTKSTATSGKEATMQSITDIGVQAANGYNIGKNFGPAGAIAGAAIGAGVGLVGRSGLKAEMTSFTDYDEGTLGTGLTGAFSNGSLRRRRRKIKMNAYNNRAAVQGTNYLLDEAYDELEGMNTLAAANGGYNPYSLAYVDDGELIETPYGTVSKVPEKGKPTDSNLVNLPEGSRILSDTLKVPGKKETFAQLGEKMITKKKSKFNDRFAENAAKLNEMNNNMIFDLLFALLESVKTLKGIKPKYKQLSLAFGTGGVNKWWYGDNFKYLQNGKYDDGYLNWIKTGLTQDVLDRALNQNPEMFSRFRRSNKNYKPTVEQARAWATDYKPSDFHKFAGWMYDNRDSLVNPDVAVTTDSTLDRAYQPPIIMGKEAKPTKTPTQAANPVGLMRYDKTGGANIKPKTSNGNGNGDGFNRNPFDWGSLVSGIAGLAPIMSNLFVKPETVDAVYNPYANAVMNAMRRRRYSIDSAIEDINKNRAINNYNVRQFNTNTGANLAYSLQSAVNTDRAVADLRTLENNYNNQYLGDYANVMNNLGQQWVDATNLAADLNAQNRGTARNIRRAGLSQLSQWAQNRELMRNLEKRDLQMWPLYRRFLEAGFTNEDLDAFMLSNLKLVKKKNKKGGK